MNRKEIHSMNSKIITHMMLVLIVLANLCISCRTLPPLKLTERDLELSMEHGGYRREYILHLPTDHENFDKMPLVIALHGGGGTARGMIRLTLGSFNGLADKYGFLVVYPQGLEKSWNDGRDDPISFAHRNNIDDIGFLSTLIDIIVQEYKADSTEVFVTGISNGGFMSFRVSRDLIDHVKGVAPVCAAIPCTRKNDHLNTSAINIMLINGTADPLVPYDGGYVEVLGKKRGKILSTDETLDIFVKRNNCAEGPLTEHLTDKDPNDGTTVIKYEYANNETGKKVVLIKVVHGGHTWPGGWQYLSERLIGKTSMDINACDEIWDFFRTAK
jgi:polyhydroxybutyrate depolymerase